MKQALTMVAFLTIFITLVKLYIFLLVLATSRAYDPCCSFPCKNQGICLTKDVNIYECDCTGTGYYGINCETPFFSTRVKSWLRPSKESLHYFTTHFKFFWTIVNEIPWLRQTFMKLVLKVRLGFVPFPSPYRGFDSYPTWQGYANNSMYARSLPPVPQNCPTPMGVKGKATLPDAQLVIDKFFTRRTFEPCPERTSVTFAYFAQHFTHQFFKTSWTKGMPSQWGEHNVDLSHIYGETLERQHALRSHVDGKLKYSIINNEVFPPLMNGKNFSMSASQKLNESLRFAIGHKDMGMLPLFLVFGTIWLREHNRVCDILKNENPAWDDERLFQTARLILTGETIKIVIEDYVQHLSGFHYKLLYDPTLLHDVPLGYSNQIHSEFELLYHWHALVPDHIHIGHHAYTLRTLLFNPKPMVDAGLSEVITSASQQFAGKISAGQGRGTLQVAKNALLDGRKLRMQSLNNYRKKFGLVPYKSFEDFTGEKVMARELKALYGDIDALELFVGFMLEKRRHSQLFGETLTEMGSPYSLRGLLSNPIGSPAWWKPSTFGGQKGFDIIRETNLQELICRNVAGCPSVSFRVPDGLEHVTTDTVSTRDNTSQILMKINRGYKVPDSAEAALSDQISSSQEPSRANDEL